MYAVILIGYCVSFRGKREEDVKKFYKDDDLANLKGEC